MLDIKCQDIIVELFVYYYPQPIWFYMIIFLSLQLSIVTMYFKIINSIDNYKNYYLKSIESMEDNWLIYFSNNF